MDMWQALLFGFVFAVWSLVCAMIGAAIAINARRAGDVKQSADKQYMERKAKLLEGEGN